MGLSSLLYVSRSTIPPKEAEDVLNQIVATSASKNPVLGLTGTLLFTGTHFAQVLEGENASIDALMALISIDPRHDQVRIIERGPLARRRFVNWGMAYFGPSRFVSRHVTRLLSACSPPEQRRAADWLTELMREFATDLDAVE